LPADDHVRRSLVFVPDGLLELVLFELVEEVIRRDPPMPSDDRRCGGVLPGEAITRPVSPSRPWRWCMSPATVHISAESGLSSVSLLAIRASRIAANSASS
jgi:hypothetical protein